SPASSIISAISAILLMFSFLSSGEKLRSLFRFFRMESPSSTYVLMPRSCSLLSNKLARVDLPDPERPVNQTSKDLCLFKTFLFSLVILKLYGVRFFSTTSHVFFFLSVHNLFYTMPFRANSIKSFWLLLRQTRFLTLQTDRQI